MRVHPHTRQCGEVLDVGILRDRTTGLSRGCAFVSYESKQQADAAIEKYDHQLQLPGALCPLEVGGFRAAP